MQLTKDAINEIMLAVLMSKIQETIDSEYEECQEVIDFAEELKAAAIAAVNVKQEWLY